MVYRETQSNMTRTMQSTSTAGKQHCAAGHGIQRAHVALRLPLPVPLLMQLYRPLHTMQDVDALAAQLGSARSRGCF